jgi:AcrR family transcriptional regulator
MARPKAADHDDQRQRILDEAVRAFARWGYAEASMSRLAAACRTSKAALYHYFPSKQALLHEALSRYTRKLVALADRVLAEAPAGEPALRALVRAFMREYQHSHAFHVALLRDLKHLDDAGAEGVRHQQRLVVERFATALERAAPDAMSGPERKPLTMAMLGSLNFTFAWLRPDGPMDADAYADRVVALWLDGLRGARGTRGASTGPARHDAPAVGPDE